MIAMKRKLAFFGFFPLLFFFLACTACGFPKKLALSGVEKTLSYPAKGFTRIEVSGFYDVELLPAQADSVVLQADTVLLPYIQVKHKGKDLAISMKKPVQFGAEGFSRIRVKVYYNRIERMEFSGGSKAKAGTIGSEKLAMDFSGAASFEGDLKVSGDLQMEFFGASSFSGNIVAGGTVGMAFGGASVFKGDCRLPGKVHAEAVGASTIKWSGYAKDMQLEVSGASDVEGYGMAVDNLKADVSGASSVDVSVNHFLDAQASGASVIRYKGQPKVKMEASGASSVKPCE